MMSRGRDREALDLAVGRLRMRMLATAPFAHSQEGVTGMRELRHDISWSPSDGCQVQPELVRLRRGRVRVERRMRRGVGGQARKEGGRKEISDPRQRMELYPNDILWWW